MADTEEMVNGIDLTFSPNFRLPHLSPSPLPPSSTSPAIPAPFLSLPCLHSYSKSRWDWIRPSHDFGHLLVNLTPCLRRLFTPERIRLHPTGPDKTREEPTQPDKQYWRYESPGNEKTFLVYDVVSVYGGVLR